MIPDFDDAIALTPTPNNPYLFSGTIKQNQWSINKAPNGGILSALCMKAGSLALNNYQKLVLKNTEEPWFPHPLSANLHFLKVSGYGERQFKVEVQKTSKQYAQVLIKMTKTQTDTSPIIMCMAWFGKLNSNPNAWVYESDGTTLDMSKVVSKDELLDQFHGKPADALNSLTLYRSIDVRLLPDDQENKKKERAWISFRNGRPMDDVFSLSFVIDALIPHPITILEFDETSRVRKGLNWYPTMSLDIIFHRLPDEGNIWVYETFDTVSAHDGIFEEVCKTYDPNGRLLVSGRQFAGIVPISKAQEKMRSKL
ncbi:UDP-N-acetylglucosamine--N-acetylmuramyl-(pentapeptide) pyrophosphoryl-undecaprenol N-acetylglucosamine transferase [Acrasis kona]|uniref:UDP-N-acetylglucosamine--N-acetylmuramyl-(Pentapeptide) pyrophosphoryl-undecaprenol N-acetylglucosamine transferase n=1 Tax=Acrasis kona TaxID=1008807 RepID=A0AAW2ZJG2_9EUKA